MFDVDEEVTKEFVDSVKTLATMAEVVEKCIVTQLWQVEGLSDQQRQQLQDAARNAANNAVTVIALTVSEGE